MSNRCYPQSEPDQPALYQIRIKGHLGEQWTDWFGGLTITPEENGDTLLTGRVIDQAALHGLLRQVRDLGMPLLSVNRLYAGQAKGSDADVDKVMPGAATSALKLHQSNQPPTSLADLPPLPGEDAGQVTRGEPHVRSSIIDIC